MTGRRVCSKCGYSTSENDFKCPICNGLMTTDYLSSVSHDSRLEAQWNNGYHNDFTEGRKTGEYCDRDLEESVNGGQHYHSESLAEILSQAKRKSSAAQSPGKKIGLIILGFYIFIFFIRLLFGFLSQL